MKNISKIMPLLVPIFMVTQINACDMSHPGAHQLAIELTNNIKEKICHAGYIPSRPCNGKDVRFDADLGTVVYINIYGVTDENEMEALVSAAAKFRDERDKFIPVNIAFYSDLSKSHKINSIEIEVD